ncbi:MAG: hypothetical protein ACTSRI_20855 [Promethearchaeota archaeon]
MGIPQDQVKYEEPFTTKIKKKCKKVYIKMRILSPDLSKKFAEYIKEHCPEPGCMIHSEEARIAAREIVRNEFLLNINRQGSTSKNSKLDSDD